MTFTQSLRAVFARFSAKAPLEFTVSEAQNARALNPPLDNAVVEKLHGKNVSDPFRPLEVLDAPATTEWVARQNKKFTDFILPAQEVAAQTVAFLEQAVPQGMRESMSDKYGDKYFVWRKEAGAQRESFYIKDVRDYGAPARLLLDPMQIDPSGKTDIANFAGTSITHDGKTMAYALSVSGSDKTTLRFMDVETGRDLDLVYTNFRSAVNWDRDGQGFHYNYNDEMTKSSEVRYHKMGTKIEEDAVVYAPKAAETRSMYLRLLRDSKDEDGSHEYIWQGNTERGKNALLVRAAGSQDSFREIFPHREGTLFPIHEIGGKTYALTTLGAPHQKLVCFDVNDPAPEKWQSILPEDKNDQLTNVFIWQNKIFATYSHDTGEVLKVFGLDGSYIHDAPIPPLSTFSLENIEMDETSCLVSYSNFQERGNIYSYDTASNELTLYRKSTTPIDLKDCLVERVSAVSKDGTPVPMTVIRHPDTKLDGTAATILYGYGGFNVSLDPAFSTSIAHWVRAGGIYVQANLRGGGEYGQAWYAAGCRENKQNVFDDFIACSEHLIQNNYTTNKRLAVQGGSNGGLLTLAAVLQRPDLFGAVLSQVPVADMFRFHKGSYYGYSWKSDYGDPDIKADFNAAAKYSPLHNVKEGLQHPPILITTDAHDDRVLPWHGFKMAATLQSKEESGSLTFLKTKTDGGHSAGMTEAQRFAETAETRAFLHQTLGPVNQNEYKAQWAAAQKPKAAQSCVGRAIGKFKR